MIILLQSVELLTLYCASKVGDLRKFAKFHDTSLSTSKSYINPSWITLFSFSGLWEAKRESVSVIIIITFTCFV